MRFRRQRGTQDILPGKSEQWHWLVSSMRQTLESYGYAEIRTPLFEDTQLFIRSVGEGTDIVQKEMYTFEDRKGRSLTLRPEGTASVVRAYLENNLERESGVRRLFYIGPMYRYDRPQAGRFREFFQVGAEAIGNDQPEQDVEVIDLLMNMYRKLGLDELVVDINSVGSKESRTEYEEALKRALHAEKHRLCSTCIERIDSNPLRILDCKNPKCQEVAADLPSLRDFLDDSDREYDESVRTGLESLGIRYRVNARLVRGLDYYNRTAFEVHYPPLGAQSAIGGGGRYDGLVEACGGPATPAVGWSAGIERVLFALEQRHPERLEMRTDPEILIMPLGVEARRSAMGLANRLRSRFRTAVDLSGRSLKAQLRSVGKSETAAAVLLGDEELESKKATVRDLRRGKQSVCGLDEIPDIVSAILRESKGKPQ